MNPAVTVTASKKTVFLDSTGFASFCTVPKNQVSFAKVLYCPKTTKKPIFSGPGTSRAPRLEKNVFLVFFGQYSAFAKKDWLFWDSTVFLLIFLQKCCTVPTKPILCCKNAVLYQKNQKKQSSPVLGPRGLQDWKRLSFFGFFGTVQHFCKKRLVFLGQYSVFVTFLAKVLYCPKKTNPLLQKCCTVPKKTNLLEGSVVGSPFKTGKRLFFVFFGQYSTSAKKDWFFGTVYFFS